MTVLLRSLRLTRSHSISVVALVLVPACSSSNSGPAGAGAGSSGGGATGASVTGSAAGASSGASGSATGGVSGASAAGASGSVASGASSGVTSGAMGPMTGANAGSTAGAETPDAGAGMGDAGAGDGGASVACANLPLCDTFETDTVGLPPDPNLWLTSLGCNPNMANIAVAGGGITIGVDSAQHHSGTKSLRVVGGDSCGYYAITTKAFSALGSQVYARFYARFSGDPAGDGGVATMNHNGFLSMYSGEAATVADAGAFLSGYNNLNGPTSGQLRLGCQANVLDWNDIINGKDSTLPDLSPTGIAQSFSPRSGEWDCYEFHVDETNDHIEFWFNGASIAGLTWAGTAVPGVSTGWSTGGPPPLSLQSFGLGWLQLSVVETAWYDDVALSTTRIGCQ